MTHRVTVACLHVFIAHAKFLKIYHLQNMLYIIYYVLFIYIYIYIYLYIYIIYIYIYIYLYVLCK